MTDKQFLQELEKLKAAGFLPYLRHYRVIRIISPDGKDFCPVTGVCFLRTGRVYNSKNKPETMEAGRDIGLTEEKTRIYIRAADAAFEDKEQPLHKIRRSFLKVLKLKE